MTSERSLANALGHELRFIERKPKSLLQMNGTDLKLFAAFYVQSGDILAEFRGHGQLYRGIGVMEELEDGHV